jgi:hypothetical protein
MNYEDELDQAIGLMMKIPLHFRRLACSAALLALLLLLGCASSGSKISDTAYGLKLTAEVVKEKDDKVVIDLVLKNLSGKTILIDKNSLDKPAPRLSMHSKRGASGGTWNTTATTVPVSPLPEAVEAAKDPARVVALKPKESLRIHPRIKEKAAEFRKDAKEEFGPEMSVSFVFQYLIIGYANKKPSQTMYETRIESNQVTVPFDSLEDLKE